MEEGEVHEGGHMTVVEHLTELRKRLMIVIAAIAVGAVIGFIVYNPVLSFLKHPYCASLPKGRACSLYLQDPLEGFAVRLKVAGYTGLFLAFPVIVWQLWRFVTPGLHPKEKRYAIPFVLVSIVLFVAGAAVAYLTFTQALRFLQSVGGSDFQQIYSPGKYLRLVMLMFLAFGLAFEFPVLLVFLELAGVLHSGQLRKWRRPAAVIILVVAAVITPSQDPWSLMAMAVPMYIFYEASILIGRLLKK